MAENIIASIDGPLFRQQRQLLIRLAAHAHRGKPFTLSPNDRDLLEGLINLTDAIADEAYDRYGVTCLLTPRSRD